MSLIWKPHILPLDHQDLINGMTRFHLRWWMDTNCFIHGTYIYPPEYKCIPFHGCQPLWMEDQSQLYINILEIMAVCSAQKKAIQYIHHSCVMISTNNTTVVLYINKQGGIHSPKLCRGMGNPPLVSGT